MLDTIAIRSCFPALSQTTGTSPVIHFDNPAGTQVPRAVIDGYVSYLEHSNANTGGAFPTSRDTDAMIADARVAMADLLGAGSPDEIIFGQNMTSLTFHLAQAIGSVLSAGDEVVTTRLEHDANVAPWLGLQDRGVRVRFIDIHTADTTLDLDSARAVITDRTKLVTVGYASNAFGTINDVGTIAKLAHEAGAWVFVDAVHYAAHGPIDVQEIGADLLACSPYKFFGPHLGVLYGRRELLASLPSQHVRPAGDVPPGSWETGTLSHEALAALLCAITYLETLPGKHTPSVTAGERRERLLDSMTAIKSYERRLSDRLIPGLLAIDGLRIYGITEPGDFDRRAPTVSFTVEGHRPEDVAARLAEQGVYSWSGDHFAIEPMRRLGIETTQRIGLVHYNTLDEIDRFLECLRAVLA